MLPVQVVGDPPAAGVVLDAMPDPAAVAGLGRVFHRVEVLGLEHLQLQRQLLEAAPWRPPADQHLAALDQGPVDQGLQAIEIGQAIGVGLLGPACPDAVDLGICPRHDPDPDRIGGVRLDRPGGVGVVADQIARPVAQSGHRRADLGVGVGAVSDPALGAAAEVGAFIPAGVDCLHRRPGPDPTQARLRGYPTDRIVQPGHQQQPPRPRYAG